jgi:hypothetical protein
MGGAQTSAAFVFFAGVVETQRRVGGGKPDVTIAMVEAVAVFPGVGRGVTAAVAGVAFAGQAEDPLEGASEVLL